MAPLHYDPPDPQGFIRFHQSDGDPERHPRDNSEYIRLPLNHGKNRDWREKVGKAVARVLMGLDVTTHSYCLSDFPEGYGLYEHPRKNTDSRPSDLYLFGSDHGRSFRSTNEFIPHAIWLLTCTDFDRDREECECKYISRKSQEQISEALALRFRRAPSARSSPARPPRQLPTADLPPCPPRPEREDDFNLRTRTVAPRQGELIWVKLPANISSPSSSNAPSIPPISFWPCLVVLLHKPQPYIVSGASSAPPQSQKVWESRERSRPRFRETFTVRALGSQQQTTINLEDTLPYIAYTPPGDLTSHLATLRPNPFATFASLRRALPFTDPRVAALPHGAWNDIWPAYAFALETANLLNLSSLLTDPYLPSTSNVHTRCEGMFLGSDRIWEGDLVRLYLPPVLSGEDPMQDYRRHVLRNISGSADKRGVFVRVSGIHLLDRSKEENPSKTYWAEGMIYETVPKPLPVASSSSSATVAGVAQGREDGARRGSAINAPLDSSRVQEEFLSKHPILSLPPPGIPPPSATAPKLPAIPPPPEGYNFRALLAPSEHIYIALDLLVGRYYPFISSSLHIRNEGVDDDNVWQMAGLREAKVARVSASVWFEEREGRVERAEKKARERLEDRWGIRRNGQEEEMEDD